jgi:hypothetical protein
MNVVSCNVCGKEVRSYAVENIEHKNQEPRICKCEDNVITIVSTEELTYRSMPRMKVARVQCKICTHNTSAVIPEIINKPSMVKLYCAFCRAQQYHDVKDRPFSLLDSLLT